MNIKHFLSITPPNTYERDGKRFPIRPDEKVFQNKDGLYRFKDDELKTPFLFIDSYRDTLLHLTVWRVLSSSGVSYLTDCRNLIPYTYEETI